MDVHDPRFHRLVQLLAVSNHCSGVRMGQSWPVRVDVTNAGVTARHLIVSSHDVTRTPSEKGMPSGIIMRNGVAGHPASEPRSRCKKCSKR